MPLYQQVAAEIRRRIKAGDIPPGHAVPSEQEIENEFEVSRITATKALRLLRSELLVYLVPGRGTFVGPEDVPRVSKTSKPYERIAGQIAQRIEAGELRPNFPIPSEKTLMQQYEVAKGTVRRAVALLREEGWVFTVSKRGSYVSPPESWPVD